MSSDQLPSADDFEFVGTSEESDEETEWLELEAGEHVIDEVRDVRPNCGQHNTTVLELAPAPGDDGTEAEVNVEALTDGDGELVEEAVDERR